MVFFDKPAGGPDNVGGVWPWAKISRCRNRSGATLLKGEVAMLAFGAGNFQATEIATNDSNSYRPGASNDTIWNTVVDPRTNGAVTATNAVAGVLTGGVFGVAMEDILDNASGNFQFFGIIEDAFVIDTGASKDGAQPSQLLTVTITNSFDCHIATNKVIVGFYIDSNDATLTNRQTKRVFLTNGMFTVVNGAQAAGIVRS